MSNRQPHVQQFPPGVYDVLTGATSQRIFRVLSLSTTLPQVPGVNWMANKEHWFSTAGIDLTSYLGSSNIKVVYVTGLGTLQQIATELADPTKYTFQLYAKGVLTQNDWIPGTPSYAVPAYYFQAGTTATSMRPLFEVSSADHKKLVRATWFTLDNKLTGYFPGAKPGETISLAAAALSTIPTNGYYYRAP